MKQLFLTSEVNLVAGDIARRIQTPSGELTTAYITTPIEKGHEDDELLWHEQNKSSMQKAGSDIFEYTITGKTPDELAEGLSHADVLYVEGGSLVHMLNQARASGFDNFVRDFVESGKPYIGTSTGSFIASIDVEAGLALENYFEDDFDTRGIGLVDFLVMPHWGTDEFKSHYETMPKKMYHTKTPMIILNDAQYVWVQDENMQIVDVT